MSQSPQDDEIDLGELFATVWARKSTVVACTVVALGVAGVYVTQVATPIYEAKSRFELLDTSSSNSLSGLGDLGGLAALSGFSLGAGGGEADTLEDRILSRPFIDDIYAQASFGEDPSFNPELRDPGLRTRLTRWITGAVPEPMDRDDFLGAALAYLTEAMSVTVMPNGLIEVGIQHADPARAAEVTNIIVTAAIADIHDRARETSREKLAYFAEQLSEVQSELDAATRALSDYALSNDLRSQEDLARASTQLVSLRDSAAGLRSQQSALAALAAMGAEAFSGAAFAETFPVANDVEFRRALRWGVTAAEWNYPGDALISGASEALQASLDAVERNIARIQGRAEVSGEAAIELAELQRNVQVQTAIYTAMIQQFETQSFATGFESASGRLIDPAVEPSGPSSPKTALIGALSIVLGGFVGTALALIRGMLGGRLHTARAILDQSGGAKTLRLPRQIARGAWRPTSARALRRSASALAVDQLAAGVPDDAHAVALLPTADGAAVMNVALGLSQKLAALRGDAVVLSLGRARLSLAKTEPGAGQLLGRVVHRAAPGVDWVSATDLKLDQIEALLTAAAERYQVLIVVTEPTDASVLQAQRAARRAGAAVVLGQAGVTTREALAAALSVASAECPTHITLAAV